MLIEARTGKAPTKFNQKHWGTKKDNKEQKMQISFLEKTHPNDVELLLKYVFVRESEQTPNYINFHFAENFENVIEDSLIVWESCSMQQVRKMIEEKHQAPFMDLCLKKMRADGKL